VTIGILIGAALGIVLLVVLDRIIRKLTLGKSYLF